MNKIFSTFLVLTIYSTIIFGQNEYNIWYFGCNAGINFNGSTPVALVDGMYCENEGGSSVCNKDGALLFYTDGKNVWDKNHNIMSNGTDLSGGGSSTQSSLIVKKPGYLDKYYIFTTDHQAGPKGLRYSEVNMSLNCGLGNITSNKDILITTPVCEKVAAVLHENGRDFWIITHIFGTNSFYSYLLTSSGLDFTPVISNIGQTITGFGYTGYLKGSSNGDKIASVIGQTDFVQVFDFDNSTGVLSNDITLNNFSNPLYGAYGVEFSPNSNLLYIAEVGPQTQNYIYQYNLLSGSPQLINDTRVTIGTTVGFQTGALQLASNDKIYHSIWGKDSLAVIDNPDIIGLGCSYQNNGFYLGGKYASGGLPARPNIINNPISFYATNFCFGDSTAFSINTQNSIDSILWNFDDPNSGFENYSNLSNPSHQFTDTGTFYVELIVYSNFNADTIQNYIKINNLTQINMGNDTTLCNGQTIVLEAFSECGNIVWQDNSNNSSFEVNQPGIYSVNIDENSCNVSDTIVINYKELPVFNLGNDTTLCTNEILTLTPTNGTSYLWQDNSNDSVYIVKSEGKYSVVVTDSSCSFIDSISVQYINCDSLSFNSTFSIGNVFTPNNDGINDLFYPIIPENIYKIEFIIVNRWGNIVYNENGNDKIKGWDGNYLDKPCPDGVYYWIINFTNYLNREEFTKHGFFHLIHE